METVSILPETYGSPISSGTSGVETYTVPPFTVAQPSTAIFHLRNSALPEALSVQTPLIAPFAIVMSDDELTPGGFQIILRLIGSSNPESRRAFTFKFIEPPWTKGTLGSSMSILKGAASTTATYNL